MAETDADLDLLLNITAVLGGSFSVQEMGAVWTVPGPGPCTPRGTLTTWHEEEDGRGRELPMSANAT